jgi:hypothetical protein
VKAGEFNQEVQE